MVSVAGIAIGGLLLAIAGGAGWYGRRKQARQELIEETPTTDVRDIREEGLVELKGEVRAEETFRSPIRDEESVLAAWEIEEWEERGDSSTWQTIASGVYARPFSIEDGTGEVRVEVGDHVEGEQDGLNVGFGTGVGAVADALTGDGVAVENVYCEFETFPIAATIPPDRDPPEHIAEFVAGESGVSTQTGSITNVVDMGNKHGERRYSEQTLQAGQEVYLLGEARASPDAARPLKPEDVAIRPPAEEPMIVSDQSEESLASELGRYRWVYAAAAVFGVAGIALVVASAGVL